MAEASRGPRPRPLSPHVQIWRWHVTMASSILHRATGVALYVGALILAGWAVALASGEAAYESYKALLGSLPGKVVLFGLAVSVFYHLANGVRHLVWDAGYGFTLKVADRSAWAAIGFGVVAAIALFVVAGMTGAL
ncbi:MAG: succinate dehydrogenase, cytochrome b556 subunit [Caulobacterales bacterium]